MKYNYAWDTIWHGFRDPVSLYEILRINQVPRFEKEAAIRTSLRALADLTVPKMKDSRSQSIVKEMLNSKTDNVSLRYLRDARDFDSDFAISWMRMTSGGCLRLSITRFVRDAMEVCLSRDAYGRVTDGEEVRRDFARIVKAHTGIGMMLEDLRERPV